MANTVTAFYTFSANTPAQSAQVNNNFDVFRGTIVPVNDDTQTASDLAHDFGHTQHRWKDGYFDRLFLAGDTISGSDIGTTSTGEMVLNAISGYQMNVAGTIAAEIPAAGIAQLSPNRLIVNTTTAEWGGIARNTVNTHTVADIDLTSSAVVLIADTTITLQTVGRPVSYEFYGTGTDISAGTTSSKWFTTLAGRYSVFLYRNGSVVASLMHTPAQAAAFISPNILNMVDMSAPAGSNEYYISVLSVPSSNILRIGRMGFRAREI